MSDAHDGHDATGGEGPDGTHARRHQLPGARPSNEGTRPSQFGNTARGDAPGPDATRPFETGSSAPDSQWAQGPGQHGTQNAAAQGPGQPWNAPAQPQNVPGPGVPGGPGNAAVAPHASGTTAYSEGNSHGGSGFGAGAFGTAAGAGITHQQGSGSAGPAFGPSQNHTASPGDSSAREPSRGLAIAGSSALLAAALASAGTYAVVKSDDGASVTTSSGGTVVKADPGDFSDAGAVNWSGTAQKVSPSVVSITVTAGSSGGEGSGVVLDKAGNIVTNNHVVSGAGANADVTVTLNNNRTYKASVVGTDPSTDLAVIRIKDVPDLTPVEMGDDSKLVVGQPVMAVGNPLGLAGTVTTGIVSALDRPVTTSESQSDSSSTSTSTVITNAIQTSAAINPGNSGGALVSGSGKLIGINSSIASLSSSDTTSQSGNIGIGFAIPTTVVKNITGQLIKSGKAQHALLGIGTEPTEVKSGNATLSAAKVSSVADGSGAQKAGLKVNDAIIAIDGDAVTSANALVGQVRSRTVGSTVTLTLVRDGKQQDVKVTLGAQSATK